MEKTGSTLLQIDGSERDRQVRETDVSERQMCQKDRWVREKEGSEKQRCQRDRHLRETDRWVREKDGSVSAVWLSDDIIT